MLQLKNIFRFLFLASTTLKSAIALPKAITSAVASPAALPVPRNIVYVQTFTIPGTNTPVSLLDLINNHAGITHIILASFHINSVPGDIRLNDDPPNATMYDQLWSQVTTVQKQGVKVMGMVGGAAQGSYTILENNSTFDSYYLPLLSIIKTYKLDGLDLDIEESIPLSTALTLLQRLDADLDSSFILTMAPVGTALLPAPLIEYGLSGFNYPQLDLMATSSSRPGGKLISWYNAQFYNGWGDSSSQVFYDLLTLSQQFSPSRIVMGVLDSSADGGSGWNSLSTYQSVIKQLRANYVNFGGVVGWEYFNAGSSDGLTEPWQWVAGINSALTAPRSSLPPLNTSSAPLLRPAVPWPAKTTKLQTEGTSWQSAVGALNRTNGNLSKAQQLLGIKT